MRPVANPPNPWLTSHVEWLEAPPEAKLEVYEEEAKSIVAENQSPDVGFRFSVNPYRGCLHACAYCYARPGHQYLGYGAGTDFERRIVAKVNAPELLRRHLAKRSWRGDTIVFSGVTDCYQPLEACYELTRRCLEVCREHRNPVALVTKGILVCRDRELLAELARVASARVYVSIPFADDELARRIEPGAAPPSRRFAALRALHEAGVPVGVAVAPLIPGLTDSHVPAILEQARAAGADRAFLTLLRLPAEVLPVFTERLRAEVPERFERVLSNLREMRQGRLDESRFGVRMTGSGARWAMIERMFELHCRRLGFVMRDDDDDRGRGRDDVPPRLGPQGTNAGPRQGVLWKDDLASRSSIARGTRVPNETAPDASAPLT